MGIDVNVRETEKSGIRILVYIHTYTHTYIHILIAQIELTRRHMCLHSRHKNVEFHWLDTHEQAFLALKNLITQNLRYYDVSKAVTLQVDASKAGLGAALIQEHGPVAFASKAMNETQCRYAQIEKELLAVVFACKRFHQYVYGKHIKIESDHKPLEAIFKKPLSQAPSRLQKMLMQLQAYDITLVYKKGAEMYIADALSRANPPDITDEQFEELLLRNILST